MSVPRTASTTIPRISLINDAGLIDKSDVNPVRQLAIIKCNDFQVIRANPDTRRDQSDTGLSQRTVQHWFKGRDQSDSGLGERPVQHWFGTGTSHQSENGLA